MADLGTWKFLHFIVNSTQMLSFKDLQLTGSCETENKESGKAQWVVHKKMKPYELSTTVVLNRRMGVTDVQGTAEKLVQAAREGWYDLFTVNGRPVINQLSHPVYWMLTSATVSEIEIAPDGTWTSCSVKCSFKFYHKGGSSSGSSKSSGGGGSGSSGSKKKSSKGSSKKTTSTPQVWQDPNKEYDNEYREKLAERLGKSTSSSAKQSAKKTTDTAKKQSTSSKKSPSRAKHVEFNPSVNSGIR